jgi:hypothetical protein
MDKPVVIGKYVKDRHFEDDIDYSKEYYGYENNIFYYKVITTFSKDFESGIVRNSRDVAQKTFKGCYNINTFVESHDIYNFLTNPNNILIAILENDTYHMFCMDRTKASKRAMNDARFRSVLRGESYVKFLPKTWTNEYGFQSLLNTKYSVYMFKTVDDFDRMHGYVEDPEDISLAQYETYGKFVKLMKAWDLLYVEKILIGDA